MSKIISFNAGGGDITRPYFNPRRRALARQELIRLTIDLEELVEIRDEDHPRKDDEFFWSERQWKRDRIAELRQILDEE